jgi:MinD superfamily P-loop ATPase
VIIDLKKYAIEQLIEEKEYEFVVIDTAPGAHCDVEHSLDDVDKVICVTEPTPLGRHDLDRILQLCEFINKDSSIVLNRSDMADYDEGIQEVATEHKSEIISRIPLSRDVMETYARGIPIMAKRDKYGVDHPVIEEFDKIISIIKEMRKNG